MFLFINDLNMYVDLLKMIVGVIRSRRAWNIANDLNSTRQKCYNDMVVHGQQRSDPMTKIE